MHKGQNFRGGFALPTVLIASVVMLIVLSVSVTSVAAVRTTLKTQYYEQLAKAAGEAGVAYAKACLSKNGNKPLWTDAKPLKPSTDCAGNPLLNPEVQVLVVAGGGGGANNHGGGGGGGGVVTNNAFTVAGGQAYTVVVGGGGAGGGPTGAAGTSGGASSFAGLVNATGGGGGGGRINTNSVTPAGSGGSGGGGAGTIDGATGIAATGASGIAGQGYAGGNGSSGSLAGNAGGGGGAGGAGGAANGIAGNAGISGTGGPGFLSDISGAILYYGGGGSGGRWAAGSVGDAGITGGGRGGDNDGVAGKPGQINTGGGGGGGGGGVANGASGGSGVVYVRYANNGTINASGGSITSVSGPYKVHAFTTTGSSSFTVSSATSSVCPSDPRCSVVVNDSLRSSFSVLKPSVDTNGRALTIPNSGYVELIRSSTGAVWRTYRQPAVQVAVVPDLCSGAASSTLGWQSAVVSATQETIPNASSAQTITLTDGGLAAGKIYFRKDFTVLEAGAYNLSVLTTDSTVLGESYIDGVTAVASQGGLSSASTNLSVGCHTFTVQLTNKTVGPRAARFTAAIGKSGSAPIVATDSSWRVSSGSTVSYSNTDFYADPSVWVPVTGYTSAHAAVANSTWAGVTGDPFTAMISPAGNGCPSACPFDSTAYLRDSKDIYLAADTEVLIATICDNACVVHIDGQVVLNYNRWNDVAAQSLTLSAGYHHVGIQLYNSSTAVNPAGVGLTIVNKATGATITRTDRSWLATNSWRPGVNGDISSYEASFAPSPKEIIEPVKADVLIVAGGGGGGRGGGGAGGGLVARSTTLPVGSYTVTIGGGGAGSASANGTNGGNSVLNGVIAYGGGGGGGASSVALPGNNGGSGGGGGLSINGTDGAAGGNGTAGQGNGGGLGLAYSCSPAGGGGGAGAPGFDGVSTKPGNGGAGIGSLITGVPTYYAGGGGGGSWCLGGSLGAESGGNGATATGAVGLVNTGGGGGGAGANGGSGGASGGSGVVVIRFKTGSATLSATPGSSVFSQPTINNVKYDVYKFTSTGTFTVSALNPS